MNMSNIVDETAAVVGRLRAAYTSWNNPPSDGLPEGAEVVLEAADLLERLSRERGTVPEGWQDISTAPKDGSEILGWRSDSGVLLIRWTSYAEFLTDDELADYSEDAAHQEDWFYADFIHGGRIERCDGYPTYWMPLPPAPGDRTDTSEIAQHIRQAELEAYERAAKVADAEASRYPDYDRFSHQAAALNSATQIAQAIRSLSEDKEHS